MPYTKTSWQNQPSTATPINAANLNKLETQYEQSMNDSSTYTDSAVSSINKNSVGLGNVDNTSDADQPNLVRGEGNRSYRFIAGTLRYVNATTWEMVEDAGHRPTGVASVEYSATRLRVNFNFTASRVVTFIASPDETIATIGGIRMGSSVGTSFADIYIYSSAGGATPVNPNTLSNTSGNIWIYGVMEV